MMHLTGTVHGDINHSRCDACHCSVIGHQLAAAHSSKKPFDQTEFWKTAKEHTSKHADKKENYAELKKVHKV